MKKLTVIAVAAALVAFGRSATAQLVADQGTADFTTSGSGGSQSVNYFVNYDSVSGLYTYMYQFNLVPTGTSFATFEVNASYVSSVLASGNVIIGALAALDAGSLNPALVLDFATANTTYASDTPGGGSVYYFQGGATSGSYAFGFTSIYGPSDGSGSIIDGGNGPWGDNGTGTPIPVPAPVPEASTVMAGALMLLPLGLGAIRAIRKERTA